MDARRELLHLRSAGVSFVLDVAPDVPLILHWGAALPDDESVLVALRDSAAPAVLDNAPNAPRVFSVWPSEYEAWAGTPALEGHVAGAATTPRPVLRDVEHEARADGGRIRLVLDDRLSGLRCTADYDLDPAGVLSAVLAVERDHSAGPEPYTVSALTALLPLPSAAVETLDFTGLWAGERRPQRSPLLDGLHLRRTRRGKPGQDSPYVMMCGERGFGARRGEVWSAHAAWSGDQRLLVERLPEGAGVARSVLGGGESLAPGEVRLAAGERYSTPPVLFAWSDEGTDGIARRFHDRLRRRERHPRSPRPLTLNSWEAVYFDHDLERLLALVDAGAGVGVERFVLDDGWFRGRRNARAGLGDWIVDEQVWSHGLEPLVQRVRAHGMQFGLWVEPEMISLDSDLARAHPDWVLGPAVGLGPPARNQYVLDLGRPEAHALVLARLDDLVSRHRIDFLKWDHNRDLLEAVSREDAGRPAVHRQTLAVYALLDELRRRHPGLEIESCASGGGRVDLGILDRADRVWASDSNDPVERIPIVRWTQQLLPLELIGAHIGDARAHTSGRVTDFSFRAAVALFGHAGIEMDLTRADPSTLRDLTAWAALYRELRPLLHSGEVVNGDPEETDPGTWLFGVVDPSGGDGVFLWARTASSGAGQSGRVRFPGLDPARSYAVRVRDEFGGALRNQAEDPAWVTRASMAPPVFPGAMLTTAGLPLPTLAVQQAMVLHFEAI
ncbi:MULTISPECIES: alpha-galactosidase [unclassified Microbacterium]|uniref:alpha-galactosidase n=1 Tax=unclassified Microbacterium TaxID=2609290 RepID=UPI000CFCC653|nr:MULTISPECIES: alpha-galactosidase [unclassified Microbacterium]PQZ54567.1 alpha-galactosidase [Microbacterium sp. MYb43]PQZ74270.1 alpha-galactosidase [Microbacterium sp. MYb40]PRB17131.1 alpha-galactosidase [Microbacterium sp. MYb54]PRB25281.1 alpha-galactosidase [Microbacterium sp. MYb50]PRB63786.1 alpha-galactosidase [Microbacterium sp. MYb24]